MLQRCRPSRSPPPRMTPKCGSPVDADTITGARSCGKNRCSHALYGRSDTTSDTAAGVAPGAIAADDGTVLVDETALVGERTDVAIPCVGADAEADAGGASAISSRVHCQPSRLRNRIDPRAVRAPSTA